MATVTDVESAVRETLDRFAQAYAAWDIDPVMRVFAPGDDIQLMGTGADEIRLGRGAVREQIERDFAEPAAPPGDDAAGLRYSVAIAFRRSSRAARRAGRMPASIPAAAPAITTGAICVAGAENTETTCDDEAA